MIGYTEVLQVMGAMIIFSLVLTTTNRFMLNNTTTKIQSEVEVRAITIAQDIIEFSKSFPFDEATQNNTVPDNIPNDFVNANPVPGTTAANRNQINFLEDFNGYSETINSNVGEFVINTVVEYMNPADLNAVSTSKSIYKRITVNVTNASLNNNIALSYTRVYNNRN
jgi:hypothetical protein